jgi:hypothetical protein
MTKARPGGTIAGMEDLSREERKSLTHGEFWIPESERVVYQLALRTLDTAGIRFVISGLYAIYEYTGIYRQTKDLDLFFQPEDVIPAARALKDAGFQVKLRQGHWLAKAAKDDSTIDLIFGMGNGMHLLDELWYQHGRASVLAAVPVRVAPPEELLWHRLFVSERHRSDMADVIHLILMRGDEMDWQRVLQRLGEHWRILLAQLHLFDYVYPGHRRRVPDWVRQELNARALEPPDPDAPEQACRGTLISRFSFAIDVNEWGFRDLRAEAIARTCELPIIRQIRESDVWDARESDDPDRE